MVDQIRRGSRSGTSTASSRIRPVAAPRLQPPGGV